MKNLPNYLEEHSAVLEVEETGAVIQRYQMQIPTPVLNQLLTYL